MEDRKKLSAKKYVSISMHPDTLAELSKIRQKKSVEVGIDLSWNDYFALLVKEWKEFETLKPQKGARP